MGLSVPDSSVANPVKMGGKMVFWCVCVCVCAREHEHTHVYYVV